PGLVAAVWWALEDYASQQTDRGSVEGFDVETLAVFYGWEESDIRSVVDALREKNLISEANRLTNWEKRQPKREREDRSTDRVRRYREKKRNETPSNANVTPGNAQIREDKRRVEETREENTVNQPPAVNGNSPDGGRAAAMDAMRGDLAAFEK